MSKFIEVIAVVEGKTEEVFINSLLKPYLANKNIFMYATQVTKPGQKGGDVKFSRVKNDIELHLKQRSDIYVTTFVDYYGVKEWPGVDAVVAGATPAEIAKTINIATKAVVVALFESERANLRFIPYISIHEFESLLFSDPNVLSKSLTVSKDDIEELLVEQGEPEAINNSPQTAPSKRLDAWSNGKFPKTTTGIAVAKAIGISAIREKCPVFNAWLATFEKIQGVGNETQI